MLPKKWSVSNITTKAGSGVMLGVMGTGLIASPSFADTLSGSGSALVEESEGAQKRLEKVRDAVVDYAKALAEIGVAELRRINLGDLGEVAVKGKSKVVDNSDKRIVGHPERGFTTGEIRSEGKIPVWTETVATADGTLSGDFSALQGGLSLGGGFETGADLTFRAFTVRAMEDGQTTAEALEKDEPMLPITAKTALALALGEQFEVSGRGIVSGRGSAGGGLGFGFGPVGVNLTAGGNASTDLSADYAIDMTRLDGNRVHVTLSRQSAAALKTGAGVHVGIAASGTPFQLGVSTIADKVEKEAERLLDKVGSGPALLDAGNTAAATDAKERIASFTIDLSKPAGKAAYEGIMRLDLSAAQDAARGAAGKDDAVSMSDYSTSSSASGTDSHITVLGKKLLLDRALRTDSEGKLATDDGVTLTRTSKFERNFAFFATGKKSIKWEGVAASDGKTSEGFYHLSFGHVDRFTSVKELGTFSNFVRYLGARHEVPPKIKPPRTNFLGKLFTKKDDRKVAVDIYFTKDGIDRIGQKSSDQAFAAYLGAAAFINGDTSLSRIPEEAFTILRQYNQVRAVHEDAEMFSRYEEAERAQSKLQSIDRRYQKNFGRKIDPDSDVVKKADAFARNIGALTGASDDLGWASLFADIGEEEGFSYTRAIAAMAKLAGEQETIVHKLEMKGEGIDVRAVDEGRPSNPIDDAKHALKPPTSTDEDAI